MTIATTQPRVTYAGDGVTTVFPIPSLFYLNSDVLVEKQSAAGTVTTWVLNSDYTLTGAGVSSGGSLTATVAPASGETLSIIVDPPQTQASHFVSNQPFPSSSVEQGFDRLTQMVQRLADKLSRTIRGPDTDTISWSTLPSATSRANTYLTFDGSGNPSASTTLPAGSVLSQGTIGLNLWPQTAAEAAAAVTPSAYYIQAMASFSFIGRYNGSLSQALSVASSNPYTIIIDSAITVSSNLTVPATCTLEFRGAGSITVSNTFTLVVNGLVISNKTQAATFLGAGTTTIGSGGNYLMSGNLQVDGGAYTLPVAVPFSATAMTLNCSLSNVFKTTFTANVTVAPTISNPHDGQTIIWRITQDATGGRTMTWPSNFKPVGAVAIALSTAANARDWVTATYSADLNVWDYTVAKGFG